MEFNEMTEEIIELRGHHIERIVTGLNEDEWKRLIEASRYYEKDEWDFSFGTRVYNFYEMLKNNPSQKIRIIETTDPICNKCPKLSCGRTSTKHILADRACAKSLGLKVGEIYTVAEVLTVLEPKEMLIRRRYRDMLELAERSVWEMESGLIYASGFNKLY